MSKDLAIDPFDIREGRAMVSLGPLTSNKHCTFDCSYCYVPVEQFGNYPNYTVPEIVRWLGERSTEFDIVYVSGDTDSFAKPRTNEGLDLLEAIASDLPGKDVLFTTKYVLNQEEIDRLDLINQTVEENRRLLFGCTSVAQLTNPEIEKHPIPSPMERLRQLKTFHDIGMVSVLAMRPFLPNVNPDDYTRILEEAHRQRADIALGESWWVDLAGKIEDKTLGDGVRTPANETTTQPMPFDGNTALWKCYEPEKLVITCERICKQLGMPFFMRSRPAIEWARKERNLE